MKKSTTIIVLISICLAVIFHRLLEQLCNTVLVGPFLSDIEFAGHTAMQAAFFVLLLIGMAWGWRKLGDQYQFGPWRIFWSMLIASAYLYYRMDGTVWNFHPLLSGLPIKAADVLFLLPLYFIVASLREQVRTWIEKRKEKKKREAVPTQSGTNQSFTGTSGFRHDIAASIDKESDKDERHRFVTQLRARIVATPAGDGSFCIGIIGPWGSGKTTFLNSMKAEFNKDDDIIQISFDPWINQYEGSLTEHFLGSLSAELSMHTDLLGTSLRKYARSLVKSEQTNIWGIAAQILLPFFNWRISTVDELKENIADALRKVKKKIVVFIDDIDRLDQEEIQEVLRLIRNIAGFPNVFYIAAFDKLQVENSLKDKFELGYGRYLEKIFQIEFHLPPVRSKVLLSQLTTELKRRLDSKTLKVLEDMFSERDWPEQDDSYQWMGNYLQHYRDVNRFLNLFDLHYNFVKKEVFLPDFLVLMLLRLKYPDFYYYLYKNRFEFLTFREQQNQLLGNDGELVLKCKDEKGHSLEDTVLRMKLEHGIPDLGIQSNDIAPLNILFGVFDTNRQYHVLETIPRMRSGYKSHLSAVHSKYLSRYFDYSFTGQLSDVEFEDALSGDKEIFLQKVVEWSSLRSIGYDVIENLERYKEFPDFQTFDKVTTALMVIGNINTGGQEYALDQTDFLRRFSRISKDGRATVFPTEREVETYMLSLFEKYCEVGNWCYRLLNSAAKDKDGAYFASHKDLNSLIERTCASYFATSPTVDSNFPHIMSDWVKSVSALERENPLPVIRKYFLERIADTIPLFIGPCPRHGEDGNYKPTAWMKFFFNSEKEFLVEVQSMDTEMGRELADFMNKVADSSSECTPYVFKHLAVPAFETHSK